MGRSQRHQLNEQGSTSAGEVHAQGVVAPGIAAQVNPSELNVMEPGPAAPPYTATQDPDGLSEAGVQVPIGAPGGPLAGSSLTGAIPEDAVLPPDPNPTPPDPEPGMEPTLTSLDPNTAELDSADITLRCIGTNFTDSSVIHFSDHDEPTTFVSDTEVTTGVKPSLGWGEVAVPVTIKQGSYETDPLDFTFTAAPVTEGPEPPTEGNEPPTERTLPLGPVNLTSIDDHEDGIAITPESAIDIRVGDTVLIEATGNTTINGSYAVLSIDPVVVDNPTELLTPITAKGRVTVSG